jgi:hypothetical protein
MSNYVVAIPTYNRADVVVNKTLHTLLDGKVNKNRIYIFVANKEQEKIYRDTVPSNMYNKIVVGQLGITNQRKFISTYFPEGQYIISMDDDVEELLMMKNPEKLVKIRDLNTFFMEAYKELKKEGLYIWGIYPVRNPFFMKKKISTDLKFIIGVLFGYINRHLKQLEPSNNAETKEDYEQSILYYKLDGGVLRYNYITPKTKFHAEGGLGKDRFDRNKKAAEYLKKTYPDIITIFHRANGMTEVKFARMKRIEEVKIKTKKTRVIKNKTRKK